MFVHKMHAYEIGAELTDNCRTVIIFGTKFFSCRCVCSVACSITAFFCLLVMKGANSVVLARKIFQDMIDSFALITNTQKRIMREQATLQTQ